ncbi:MAG: hypothetical protein C0476_07340 [Sphingomonas sp.]|nr:hypothetical protein [Sphingomonas sp.]
MLAGCGNGPPRVALPSAYRWARLTAAGPFRKSYNFPVHVAPDGRFMLMQSEGCWSSRDAVQWQRQPLPSSGSNMAYMPTIFHAGAAWALGRHRGDYLNFKIDPAIQRTTDWATWEALGQASGFPQLVFAASTSFDGWMWIIGGYRRGGAVAEVWRSRDGLHWEAMPPPPWSPRTGAKAVVFGGRMLVIGGGELDGPASNDIWSTDDGKTWRRDCAQIAPERPVGFAAQVFDDRLWLVGANRSGSFQSAMLVSDDAKRWQPVNAPWSARGGVATWVDRDRLYLTGGKHSHVDRGETVFVYSNDVWAMSRR